MVTASNGMFVALVVFLALPAISRAEAEDWEKVRNEAIQATYSAPADADAWYRLAEAEEKLGNSSRAVMAYSKLVELEPTSPRSKLALERIRLLASAESSRERSTADETKEAAAPEATQNVTPPPTPPSASPPVAETPAPTAAPQAAAPASPTQTASSGISLGVSPIFKPKVSADLGSSMTRSFEAGIRMGPNLLLAFVFAKGTIKTLELSDKSIALNAAHTFWGLAVQGDIPLNSPGSLFSTFQIMIPVAITTFLQFVSARDLYSNMGVDLGAGIGGRFSLGEALFIDFGPWYHLGFPFWDLEYADGVDTLVTSSGEKVNGSTTGFALRAAVTLMFE